MPKLLAVLVTSCVLAALTPLGTAQAASGPTIDPASLVNGGRPCSATTPPQILGFAAGILQAVGYDDTYSSSGFDYTFSIWPLTDPAAAWSVTREGYDSGRLVSVQVPDSVLADDGSYAWQVQLATSNGTSPWSQVCTFSYDHTAPATPTISSANYPPYGEGLAPVGQFAQFTFDAGGDLDTAGFQYVWGYDLPAFSCSYSGPLGQLECQDAFSEPGTVRAAKPGGVASLALNPVTAGPQTLTVAALDVVGNRSPAVQYQVFVPDSGPTVSQANSHPICGSLAKVVFAPHPGLTPVSSYTYTFDQGPAVTVPADADGTAHVSIKENQEPGVLQVTSIGANGFRSSAAVTWLNVNPQVSVYSDVYTNYGQPVGGVGVSGKFTFQPPYSDSGPPTAFSYRFPNGATRTVAATDEFGSATVRWAPTRAGQQTLTVQSINADGSPGTCTTTYTFTVAR
ncbi:MAG TPA: hypothetical protein VGX49_13340 [Jatrophihabitans sp.]|nr:hypothetical protein [Jatrophihabitans sp.]